LETAPADGQQVAMADSVIQYANKVISLVSEKTDRAILFYSTGKDSIALLDLMAPHFREIVCVYMYFVKGLEHIDKYIRYSKVKYPNATFLEIPHWNLSSILKEGVYCLPNPKVKTITLKDVDENIRLKTGIEYSFYGMKQSDGLNRRLMLRSKEYELQAIHNKTNKVYPLSTWSNKDVFSYITFNKLPVPVTYSKNKKSQGLGFDLEVFLYLQQRYPKDLEKILQQFPLSAQILFEHEHRAKI
jgi:3'-phosphoadenosine 5'-phosphosulfate sulfotransferase (PAPS reductase)/FAD synthetase